MDRTQKIILISEKNSDLEQANHISHTYLLSFYDGAAEVMQERDGCGLCLFGL